MASEVRHGDCLEVVRGLAAESVDLVYVDPPFFTQKTHSLVTRDRTTKFEFSDEWKSRAEYLEFSTPLVIEVDGTTQIISPASNLVAGYDSEDGHEIWRVRHDGFSVVNRLELEFKCVCWNLKRLANLGAA